MPGELDREIILDGCVNFRDVGGYVAAGGAVRWRRLFRSDALHALTAADVEVLRGLNLTTVIDLRSGFEREHDGPGPHPLAELSVRFVHAPIIDAGNGAIMADSSLTLAERYARIVETAAEPVAAAVTAIAASPGASVFHCAAGKDRTGMVSAVVLGALGVADDDVVADYAMTGAHLEAISAKLQGHPAYETTYQYVPKDAMTADAQTMSGFIAELRARHGDMGGFLRGAGVNTDLLRAALVA